MLDIRLLDEDEHFIKVDDFSCEKNPSLAYFLKKDAFIYQEELKGTTYLVVNSSEEIIGYFTLKTNGLQTEEDGVKSSIPTIEISRLALHDNYIATSFDGKMPRASYGDFIMIRHIFPMIIEFSKKIAVNMIMVFVEHEDNGENKVVKFYRKFGFKLAKDEVQNYLEDSYCKGCKLMYLEISFLKKIYEKCMDS